MNTGAVSNLILCSYGKVYYEKYFNGVLFTDTVFLIDVLISTVVQVFARVRKQ